MSILIREYGRTLLAIVVSMIVIVLGVFYLTLHSRMLDDSNDYELENISDTTDARPVLLTPETIRLERTDHTYEKEYFLNLVEAYENAQKEETCQKIDIFGVGDILFSKAGRYQVVYRIENQNSHVFTKKVPVIVYE